MKVLVIGSGGREHALAWALERSPQVDRVYIAPGNGGTQTNIPITDFGELIQFAQENEIALTVVGPEVPLADGIVDAFQDAGLPIFGPTQAAAQLEASKAFSKDFMQAEGIPTAAYGVFDNLDAAQKFLANFDRPVVVKASGLAAGKGVIMCDTRADAEAALQQIMNDRAFGAAGDQVVIEERLTGREISVLAFCDGKTVIPMKVARDHKRALDGDKGLNTGGMGAFAPTDDVSQALIDEVTQTVLQPTVDGMAKRGTPYVGVLYAGLMLTDDGAKVLEFNCRLGDPETQVVLPLLETDLAEICLACIEGRLDQLELQWQDGYCATVVLASPGYPNDYPKGLPISGLENIGTDVMLFHAGTQYEGEQLVTSGGRVMAVTGLGENLNAALNQCYAAIKHIHFDGMHYRRDIGRATYASVGVDIEAGSRAVGLMKDAIRATYNEAVLSDTGNFGGLFNASQLKQMDAPILVASTDGVGTKTKVAAQLGQWDTIGADLVNHCINDILVQGAEPLFFLDYVASSQLQPEQIAAIVSGMARACQAAGCALLGGETAEMPGVYQSGEVDVVGTIIGTVDRANLIDGKTITAGDVILGLPSTGLHTNGYSLARHVLKNLDWTVEQPELGCSIGEALLATHRCYLDPIRTLRGAGINIKGLAHITGGGIIHNLPRILPDGLGASIQAWAAPPIFQLIQRLGNIADHEMYQAFNMGMGMLVVLPANELAQAQSALHEPSFHVGAIVAGQSGVVVE